MKNINKKTHKMSYQRKRTPTPSLFNYFFIALFVRIDFFHTSVCSRVCLRGGAKNKASNCNGHFCHFSERYRPDKSREKFLKVCKASALESC